MFSRAAFVVSTRCSRLSALPSRSTFSRAAFPLYPESQVSGTFSKLFVNSSQVRFMSAGPDVKVEKQLRELADKFGEARMEIEDAKESAETIYFNEDTAAARELVNEVLDEYKRILSSLDDKARSGVQQSWGLKIEQLKGELKELENMHAEEH